VAKATRMAVGGATAPAVPAATPVQWRETRGAGGGPAGRAARSCRVPATGLSASLHDVVGFRTAGPPRAAAAGAISGR